MSKFGNRRSSKSWLRPEPQLAKRELPPLERVARAERVTMDYQVATDEWVLGVKLSGAQAWVVIPYRMLEPAMKKARGR